MDNEAQLVAALLGAGGGGAVLLALVNGTFKWLSGASGRERQKNTDLNTQRIKAIEERDRAMKDRDAEAVKRRIIQEALSAARRQLIEAGISPGDWPELDRTTPAHEIERLRTEQKEES